MKYRCEYCGTKLNEDDTVCSHCGGPVQAPIKVEQPVVKKIEPEKPKKEKTAEKKSKKPIVLILVLAILIPLISCCLCGVITNISEEVGTTDKNIVLPATITFEINGEEISLPSKVKDFVENEKIAPVFKEQYMVNAGESAYISSVDYGYRIDVYNKTDKAINFIEGDLGSLSIDTENVLIESFNYRGITLESSYDDVVNILGLPSYKYNSVKDRDATWYSNYGWIGFEWEDGELTRIEFHHYRALEDY